jgi:hypothetical protein
LRTRTSGTVCELRFSVNNIYLLKKFVMAELHVEPKKHTSSTWIWILVSLAIIAIVAFLLLRDNRAGENNTINQNSTSYIQGYAEGLSDAAAA